MLRETNVQRLDWADKTMSVLRQQQLEACERRLMKLPAIGLYDRDDDLHAETLWQSSLMSQEEPVQTRLHTTKELRAMVLASLPATAALLSPEEHMLVERLVTLDGCAVLMDWEEVSAAETLARRLLCVVERSGDHFMLHMPDELLLPMAMILSSRQHEELREKLMRFDAIIRAMLYLGGMLHYETALHHLLADVLEGSYAYDMTEALRYLRTSYDYMIDRDGEMLLLHPGLAEPDRLLRAAPLTFSSAHPIDLDEETMAGAIEGLMPEERPLFDKLYGLLVGATRPEITEEGAVEDLRMLAKQGVSLPEMQNVLTSLLTVAPTEEMRQAVEQLYMMTPRWGEMRAGRLQ